MLFTGRYASAKALLNFTGTDGTAKTQSVQIPGIKNWNMSITQSPTAEPASNTGGFNALSAGAKTGTGGFSVRGYPKLTDDPALTTLPAGLVNALLPGTKISFTGDAGPVDVKNPGGDHQLWSGGAMISGLTWTGSWSASGSTSETQYQLQTLYEAAGDEWTNVEGAALPDTSIAKIAVPLKDCTAVQYGPVIAKTGSITEWLNDFPKMVGGIWTPTIEAAAASGYFNLNSVSATVNITNSVQTEATSCSGGWVEAAVGVYDLTTSIQVNMNSADLEKFQVPGVCHALKVAADNCDPNRYWLFNPMMLNGINGLTVDRSGSMIQLTFDSQFTAASCDCEALEAMPVIQDPNGNNFFNLMP